MLEGKEKITKESVAAFFEAQHGVQFAEGDLYSNARKETYQDGARKEIGQKSEAEYSRKQKHSRRRKAD